MKIAIIGAGIAGLTLAYRLSQRGVTVEVFEKSAYPGGLAAGFKDDRWEWPLEHHYHHIFASDKAIQKLASEIGTQVIFTVPKTSILYQGNIYKFDSAIDVLTFPHLTLVSKFRLAASLAFLKLWPRYQSLENITAKEWIQRYMGLEVWQKIWQPLFTGKFGTYADQITATWFWSRIHARTQALGYFQGGFASLANDLAAAVKKQGGKLRFNADIDHISRSKGKFQIIFIDKTKTANFDQVIVAAPSPVFKKLVPDFPSEYASQLSKQQGLGAVTLVLALKKPFFTDNTYWLNINQKAPYLAVVEHTNFMSPEHYGGDHVVYIGNYLPTNHPYFQKEADQLVSEYLLELQKLNPQLTKKSIRKAWVFKAPFAQPIMSKDYRSHIPSTQTPFPGLWWLSMEHVYPWDRGTNYAVAWAEKLIDQILSIPHK